MSRIKLMDRLMPAYTRGEERMNMITHIVGGAISLAGMILCIVFSAIHHNGYGLAGSLVFGISMIMLYTMSSVYHGLPMGMGKRVMQVLDHCTIYVLIAGTYTPVLLCCIRPVDPVGAWVLFGVVWGLAVLAIVLTSIDLVRFKKISMVLYIGIGWAIIFRVRLLIQVVGWSGFALLLSGGICYTIGAVLYGVGKKVRYMHSIFHLFVVAGTVLHILFMLLYVV